MPQVIVATVVHHPEDARIRHRQIPALLEAGYDVVYIAPPGDLTAASERLHRVEVPRASGRRRLRSLRAARRAFREHCPGADLTIIHDPELTLLRRSIAGACIWDVHEDLPAQVSDKAWIPRAARAFARSLAERLYIRGRAKFWCTIAERGYRESFPSAILVRNTVVVPEASPESGDGRVVYLGRVSFGRGADLLTKLAEMLPDDIDLDVIGPIDQNVHSLQASGAFTRGFVPNDKALELVEGATVGLSLLTELPNYRHSLPTKILEYLAHGVPVISTPLREAVEIIEGYDCGVVVPYDDPEAVARAIQDLRDDPVKRQRLAANGREAVRAHYNWDDDSDALVELCQRLTHS